MSGGFKPGGRRRRLIGDSLFVLGSAIVVLLGQALTPIDASAGQALKLGDILVAEPGTSSVSVIDAATGVKTVVSQGGLLAPQYKTIGVALALDGDIIVVHRLTGLIRVNPVTGAQSVLSQGGLFKDPWAIAVNEDTGYIYVADSGYDNDRPEINQAGKIIRVDPATGAQQLIASGSACSFFPSNAPCQNTTSAGSYLSHPYGIAIDYTISPGSLIVADMSSFNGKGAIIRLQAVPGGTQTLLWGPSSAVPPPQVAQVSPLACPMGVAVEPNGNILTSVFTYPVPGVPTFPPPAGTFYGCSPPGIFRVDLQSNVQSVLNSNAPAWQSNRAYAVGTVIRDNVGGTGHVHRVVTAGTSQGFTPNWNPSANGTTQDGTVVWRNVGLGANWQIPFGIDTEPAPTASDPSGYNVVVAEEGYSSVFRLNADGSGLASVAGNVSYTTSLDVISFTPIGGFKTEPARSDGQPSGTLPPGTTQATLSLTTDVNATCRYSVQPGVPYGSMPNTFTTTGSTSHSRTITGLASGGSYAFYVRCATAAGQTNSDDYLVSFSVASVTSSAPVAAYGFNEGGGTSAADASGNGNVGAISGASWTNDGRFGKALSFDGVNDWVTVASSSFLNFTTAMTLEAWAFPTANGSGSWRNILIKERTAGEAYNLYANADTNQPIAYVVRASQPDTALDVRGGSQLPLNTWTHLALTFDNSTLRLYVNGVQVGTRAVTGPLLTSSGSLRLGGNSIWGEFFAGRLDEIRLYNRALTQGEIQTDMNTAVGGSTADTTPPLRANGLPIGTLPIGTTQAALSLTTDEAATCRYSTTAGVAYASMPNTFTTTGSTSHSRTVTGLTNGGSYTFYIRCVDGLANANLNDFTVTFSVASSSSSTVTSSFPGAENPLSESGVWDSPGSWADLQKNAGAFTTGLNAQARRVSPSLSADQFSEITYDQDPGSSSWVGVTTRTQSASNGSGYLAIAYAGEVRLYRADDTGGLTFTLLASVTINIATAPRQLRLESQGNTHRVFFNGAQVINHAASGTTYTGGQPGVAASTFGGPQVKILSFSGGSIVGDTTPPLRANGLPIGTLPIGTTQAALSLTTDEAATCRYSTTAGVAYASMPNTFTTTGSTSHSRTVTGLTNGGSYTFYIRCVDGLANANLNDFTVTFSVASSSSSTVTSSFPGAENPLSESGVWDSPGSWADLQKNAGVFTTGLNAQARRVSPSLSADQFSEITYDQDPGSSSWVGVTTRTQSASNGSGYLAIAYAGEVRLYRADDTGGLTFTLLASVTINIATAPRQLRLESQGNTHRVFFNGAQVINHAASGTTYTGGQPGVAASTFGGPQVKILSFSGGSIVSN